ncbi:MAG: penicillin acylase family protein [Bacteroidota bacterium]
MRPLLLALLTGALVVALLGAFGTIPPLGAWLDPLDGLYRTARVAETPDEATLDLPGLEGEVTVVRDARGVPHIFADNDLDAVRALGYVVAQDRLFQLNLTPRLPAGRLAEAFGPDLVEADRFLRRTGMELGARRNLERIEREDGLELAILEAFADGVNAYTDALDPRDLPLEFHLLDLEPERWTPLHTLRVQQAMNYDLSWWTDKPDYTQLRNELGAEEYARLFPSPAPLYTPIVPGTGTLRPADLQRGVVPPDSLIPDSLFLMPELPSESTPSDTTSGDPPPADATPADATPADTTSGSDRFAWTDLADRFPDGILGRGAEVPGKGSNSWAVNGARSATGRPVLANDMHLSLTLPAIWYECRLVTPTMDVYGVAIPGAPLPVAGFTDAVAWGFTNTGSDQIDHYRLTLSDDGTQYRYDGRWLDIDLIPDTIRVKGADPVATTLAVTHWGPIMEQVPVPVAVQWTAHHPARSMQALWDMVHADGMDAFQEALRLWGAPMQNVTAASADGSIAIRSAGAFPIRRGGSGVGLLDGASTDGDWVAMVPFEALPTVIDPESGYVFSANQPPTGEADTTYLGHDWREGFRALRIEELLRGQPAHTPNQVASYHSDVRAVQHGLYVPLLDTLSGLSAEAAVARDAIVRWDGVADLDAEGALPLALVLQQLSELGWDEFDGRSMRPGDLALYRRLVEDPGARWWDIQATLSLENRDDLLRAALEATADTLAARYGSDPAGWTWGAHHMVEFQHLTQSEALQPLWRGPYPHPGFSRSVAPGTGSLRGDWTSFTTTHAASWRMVVEFTPSGPVGRGVYPGGQSGNPLSQHYDDAIETWRAFDYYDLLRPASPDAVPDGQRLTLTPAAPPAPSQETPDPGDSDPGDSDPGGASTEPASDSVATGDTSAVNEARTDTLGAE